MQLEWMIGWYWADGLERTFADEEFERHRIGEAKPKSKWDPKPGEKEPQLLSFDG